MKKAFFSFVFVLFTIFSFGQNVHKGSLLRVQAGWPTLKDGVSMQDLILFYTSKVVPEYEKNFPGVKLFQLKSIHGQDSSSLGFILIFNSKADYNKIHNSDGTWTAFGKEAWTKFTNSDIVKEFRNTFRKFPDAPPDVPDKYNVWEVQ